MMAIQRRWPASWFLLTLVAIATARADDWPHWRGPERDGHTSENSGFGPGWSFPSQPIWQAEVGHGGSSPIIVAGRAYFLGWKQNREIVTCLDLKSGELLWRQDYAAPRYGRNAIGDEGLYDGPSSTPEFDKATGLLFTLGADGELRSWDTTREGKLLWRRNLYEDYSMPRRPKIGRSGQRDYGYTAAPLVAGDWLLIEAGGEAGAVVALDKRTGEPRWQSEHMGQAGHSGGFAASRGPLSRWGAILLLNHALCFSLDERTPGKTLAAVPWTTEFANNIASVVVHEDSILVTSAYNQSKIARYRVNNSGAMLVWEQPFASKICTPVIHAGNVYWVWERAYCLDWETGRRRWSGGEYGQAGSCIATGDDRLLVWANRGKLALIEMAGRSPDKFIELVATKNLFDTDVWPHVAFADRRLLCRDRLGRVKCFALDK